MASALRKAEKFCEDPESFSAQGYHGSDKAPLSMHFINGRTGWLAVPVLKVSASQLLDYISRMGEKMPENIVTGSERGKWDSSSLTNLKLGRSE